MILQVFVDDSSSDKGEQRLFMAGYLNHPDKWDLFSTAWSEELKAEPSISYLRMVEANNLRGEFKGWSEEARNEKLRGLVRVIRHFKPFSFQFTINREPFNRKLKPVSPRGIGTPHFVCCFSVISGLARYVATSKAHAQIEFIFDQQEGVDADMAILFYEMKRSIARPARKLIGGPPVFKDDKLTPPLQAADMLAWHLRREHEENRSESDPHPVADLLRNADGHLVSHIDDSYIDQWTAHHSQQEGIQFLKSKGQWRSFRNDMVRFAAAGLIPPKGNRLKHLIFKLRIKILAILARRRMARNTRHIKRDTP